MPDRKLSPETAALVAAQLTQAQAALTGGAIAGRKTTGPVRFREHAVEEMYLRFLSFVEGGAVLPEGTDEN